MEEQVTKRRKVMRQSRRKGRGQSFMEFALTLPILLLVTLGIFDFGRALFTYAEASNALRSALRYGAILGFQADGTPQYTDCRGMINIARHISFATPSTTIKVSYISDSGKDGDVNTVTHADAIEYPESSPPGTGPRLTCTYAGGTYTIIDGDDIDEGTDNGVIILITTDANVSMVTPVFPKFMPVSIQGIRTLVKDIQLAKCGDGIWAPTETCWNCVDEMGQPPVGSEPADPGICLLAEPDQLGPPYNEIVLTWNNVVDFNVLGHEEDRYEIQYVTSADGSRWTDRFTLNAAALDQWTNVGSGTTSAGGGPDDETADIVTATLSGLTCHNSLKYQFRVRAVDTNPDSPQAAAWNYSDEVILACTGGGPAGGSVRNDSPTVTVPSPFTVSSSNPTTITLTWNDNSNDEDNFYIYRIANPTLPIDESDWPARTSPTYVITPGMVAPVGANDVSEMTKVYVWNDTGTITCGTTYYYRVLAHKTQGGEHYSNYTVYRAQAPACLKAPTLSFIPAGTINRDSDRHLAWVDNTTVSDITPTDFVIERSMDNSSWSPFLTVPYPGAAEHDLAVMSCLVPSNSGHTYYYRVLAYTSVGGYYSVPSNMVSYQYSGAVGCVAPAAPTNLVAAWSETVDSPATARISLRWDDNTGAEDRYIMEWATDAAFTTPNVIDTGAAESGTPTAWHHITGFTTCGTYYFRVKARNDTTGDSSYATASTTILCTPSFTLPASSPGTSCNGPSNDYPQLSWSAVSGATQYLLEAKTTIQAWLTWDAKLQWLLANVTSCDKDDTSATGNACYRHATAPAPTPYGTGAYNYRLRACSSNAFVSLICSWPSTQITNTCS